MDGYPGVPVYPVVEGKVGLATQESGGFTGEQYDGFPLSATSVALVNSLVVKSGAGRLFGFSGDSNKASAQFIQVFDAASLPADTAVPVIVIRVAATTTFSAYFGSIGRWFTRGIVICNSSTEATKTIGSADTWFDVQYF